MARRVIDLSQPGSHESQLHPFFTPRGILRHIVHTDAPRTGLVRHETIVTSTTRRRTSTRWATSSRGGDPLARCPRDLPPARRRVDVGEYPRGHDVTAAEVRPLAASGQEMRDGDIVLFCSDH